MTTKKTDNRKHERVIIGAPPGAEIPVYPAEIRKIADDVTDADREFMKKHLTKVIARPMIQDEFWPMIPPPDCFVVVVSFQGLADLDELFSRLAKLGGRSRITTAPNTRLTLRDGRKIKGKDVEDRVSLKKAPKVVRDYIRRSLGGRSKDD